MFESKRSSTTTITTFIADRKSESEHAARWPRLERMSNNNIAAVTICQLFCCACRLLPGGPSVFIEWVSVGEVVKHSNCVLFSPGKSDDRKRGGRSSRVT